MIRVLIVDDHDLVRMGIQRLLNDLSNIEVIAEADNGEDAVNIMRQQSPDVILMDAEMPGIGGLEATRRMLRYNPDVKIIILSAHVEDPLPSKFLEAGVRGYLTKGASTEQMAQAIQQVNVGQIHIAPEIAQQLALKSLNKESENPFDQLSDREMQVMLMITKGIKVTEISDTLCLSPKTVNSYRYRLFDKLGVEGDVELTHMALRYHLIDSL
ncbi:MAG TPA: two-component system response regulator UvrY [Aeromonadales bacterium]|nr:two-component system response regulator UvrY [Aeromonadales bacterium]